MSKNLDNTSTGMPQSKSWADVDGDDFFASVTQDRPAPTRTNASSSNSASWGRKEVPEKRSATTGGVSWTMPNLATASPTGNGQQSRFESLSPSVRTGRAGTLASWRK